MLRNIEHWAQLPKRCEHLHPSITVFAMALLSLVGCLRPTSSTLQRSARSSPQVSRIASKAVRIARSVHEDRMLSQASHGAWQVLHGVLAFPHTFEIETAQGPTIALRYLMNGGELAGWDFMAGEPLPNGRRGLRSRLESGSYSGQGHADQWFAVLAQADLPLEQELVVEGHTYTMQDFLSQTMRDVSRNAEQEWSWTLIGLSHYLPTSTSWIAADGKTWSIERLLQAELEQALNSSACGGTHRLIGISMAVEKRRREGARLDGIWQRADKYLEQAISTARQLQNSDGSFSCNYFARSGISADNAKVLATTGHTLEFLALTLPKEELQQPWVLRGVERLCDVLEASEALPLECGALYHAVHGLLVYDKRAFDS